MCCLACVSGVRAVDVQHVSSPNCHATWCADTTQERKICYTPATLKGTDQLCMPLRWDLSWRSHIQFLFSFCSRCVRWHHSARKGPYMLRPVSQEFSQGCPRNCQCLSGWIYVVPDLHGWNAGRCLPPLHFLQVINAVLLWPLLAPLPCHAATQMRVSSKLASLFFFFFFRSPAISLGFTTFGWDFCVCDRFLIQPLR